MRYGVSVNGEIVSKCATASQAREAAKAIGGKPVVSKAGRIRKENPIEQPLMVEAWRGVIEAVRKFAKFYDIQAYGGMASNAKHALAKFTELARLADIMNRNYLQRSGIK